MAEMRILLRSFNPTVGAFSDNAGRIIEIIDEAADAEADLLLLPELCVCGYPPRDLLLLDRFLDEGRRAVEQIAERARGLTVLVGAPWKRSWGIEGSGATSGEGVANCLLVLKEGRIADRYDKRLLPTYDVFDEARYFVAGDRAMALDVAGRRVGVSICEDLWRAEDAHVAPRYADRADPVDELIRAGAEVIVNSSASPFALGKKNRQHETMARHVRDRGAAIATVNQCGANDELIFDGEAAAYLPDASAAGGARFVTDPAVFSEGRLLLELDSGGRVRTPESVVGLESALPEEEQLWRALCMGVEDYAAKTGFKRALLGVSGGIDSSLVACVATRALGPENVLGVSMPSRYSSEGSKSDAKRLCDSLGMDMLTAPIESPHTSVEEALAPQFERLGADTTAGVTDENIQSRLRGLYLMAISNKTGRLLLSTGNKSEYAVGYCTLYGDMNGGLAVLADVYKSVAYRLGRWLNQRHARAGFEAPPIPEDVLTKPPSAELRPDQTDQDSLPSYDLLDEILRRFIELGEDENRIAAESGIDPATISDALRLLERSEHKRWQAPPILKVTSHAFGIGWRMPIASRWAASAAGSSAIESDSSSGASAATAGSPPAAP